MAALLSTLAIFAVAMEILAVNRTARTALLDATGCATAEISGTIVMSVAETAVRAAPRRIATVNVTVLPSMILATCAAAMELRARTFSVLRALWTARESAMVAAHSTNATSAVVTAQLACSATAAPLTVTANATDPTRSTRATSAMVMAPAVKPVSVMMELLTAMEFATVLLLKIPVTFVMATVQLALPTGTAVVVLWVVTESATAESFGTIATFVVVTAVRAALQLIATANATAQQKPTLAMFAVATVHLAQKISALMAPSTARVSVMAVARSTNAMFAEETAALVFSATAEL